MPFFKTTIVIFTDYDPTPRRDGGMEIDRLAADAMTGDAVCTEQRTEPVSPNALPDEVASFYGIED